MVKCPERIYSQSEVCCAASRASFGGKFILHRSKPEKVSTNVSICYSLEPRRRETLSMQYANAGYFWKIQVRWEFSRHGGGLLPHRVFDHLFTFSSFLLCFSSAVQCQLLIQLSCHLVMSLQHVVDLLQLLQ